MTVRLELDFVPRFLGSLALSQSVAAAPSGEERRECMLLPACWTWHVVLSGLDFGGSYAGFQPGMLTRSPSHSSLNT